MKNADNYIASQTVDCRYKPLYHLAAPCGWINDPNGFCYYQGAYHLFYQYNPYASHWSKMHWGHAVSGDLCSWKHLPVALSPDSRHDRFLGCFSGSAIEKEGRLMLMYTGVAYRRQHQMLAASACGEFFRKCDKPVIPISQRPPFAHKFKFRDPKVVKQGDKYFALIGASMKKGRQIALYASPDLLRWTYVGSLKKEEVSRGIFECPDLARLPDCDVLIYSVMHTKTVGLDYQNKHSCVYEIGAAELERGEFLPSYPPREMDAGADFYAPQTTASPDGRVLLVAWMQMWGRTIPTAYLKHGWCGMMTLPRELSVSGGRLLQKPAREVYRLFEKSAQVDMYMKGEGTLKGFHGEVFLLKLKMSYRSDLTVTLREGADCYTKITFDNGLLTFDRTKGGHPIKGSVEDGDCNIRKMSIAPAENIEAEIFVDKSSVEVFVNGQTMSNTVYPYEGAGGIRFFSEKGADVAAEIRTWRNNETKD